MGMLMGGLLSQSAGGSGDTIDLRDMSASAEDTGGASAECRVYNLGTRQAQQWYDDGGTFTREGTHVVVDPDSNINNYQMKWDGLSGDDPDNVSAAEGVWFALTGGDFSVEWEAAGGGNESTGSVTVSIREGTGSVLDTAVWDGEAISVKKGQ
jgi:hypothetical protein